MGLMGSLCYYALRKLAEKAEEVAEARTREQLKRDSIEVGRRACIDRSRDVTVLKELKAIIDTPSQSLY